MLSHVFCDLNNIFINLINIAKLRGLIMDPKNYDRIVDKLLMFRKRLPLESQVSDRLAKDSIYELKKQIDNLLWQIEKHSDNDSKGWIR